MLFFIRYQGQEHQVRVESRGGQTFVSFDGEPEAAVDLVFYGNDCMFIHDNRVFHANVVGDKTDYKVSRPQGNLGFKVESEYRRIVGLLRGQQLELENNLYAKMPGKIVKIVTKIGQKVAVGDSVIVMEAMKMENEIRATVAGTLANLTVKEGQAVDTGTLLAEITPEEP